MSDDSIFFVLLIAYAAVCAFLLWAWIGMLLAYLNLKNLGGKGEK